MFNKPTFLIIYLVYIFGSEIPNPKDTDIFHVFFPQIAHQKYFVQFSLFL